VQTKVFGPTFFQKGGPPEAYFISLDIRSLNQYHLYMHIRRTNK
jgi:hypothetical protein